MNQADVSKLVSRLRIRVAPTPRRLRNPRGSEGRLDKMRKTVTGLIKYERIELNSNTAEEARGYAERLISDAIRYGDHNADMMEMADYWLEEKQLVHKLFKVLVPRFENSSGSYTKIYRAPGSSYPVSDTRAVVELRGNPFPPLTKDLSHNRNLLHNVLLDAAKKEFRRQQYEKIAKGSSTAEVNESKPEAQESTSSAAAEREPSAKTQQPISGELADASTDPTTPGEVKIGKSELKLPQQPSSS